MCTLVQFLSWNNKQAQGYEVLHAHEHEAALLAAVVANVERQDLITDSALHIHALT